MNKKRIILIIGLLFLLAGCAQAEVNPEKIVYSTTSFMEYFKADWFGGIFVWPFAQVINHLSPFIGVTLSIGVATVLVNLLILPATLSSNRQNQKMQAMKPDQNRINKKYEGKTDQQSLARKNKELMDLYKKYDIKMGRMLLGTFITFPVLIAFITVVRQTDAILQGSLFGANLQTIISEGIRSDKWYIYVTIFVIVAISQIMSMLLPSLISKAKLKKDRRVKTYDLAEDAQEKTQRTTLLIFGGLILIMAYNWPTAMSIYWIFSSLITILRTLLMEKFYKPKVETLEDKLI